jgi:hypothetical protein
MLIRSMIDNKIHYNAHCSFVTGFDKSSEVGKISVCWMDLPTRNHWTNLDKKSYFVFRIHSNNLKYHNHHLWEERDKWEVTKDNPHPNCEGNPADSSNPSKIPLMLVQWWEKSNWKKVKILEKKPANLHGRHYWNHEMREHKPKNQNKV